jgi:type VI secretion system protein ImpB
MADDSTQHWIGRNRPPRVQITYDLETGGADVKKELPLLVGIIADLAGPDAEDSAADFKERKFIEIDRDNFNDVLGKIAPTVTVGTTTYKFNKLDDFRPEAIVKQNEDLAKLLIKRRNLNDLLAKLDGNDKLNADLTKVITESEARTQLTTSLG